MALCSLFSGFTEVFASSAAIWRSIAPQAQRGPKSLPLQHKTARIRSWFAKRPRWHVHFTPTSASWINQVERFFGLLTERQVRRGVHRSTAELEAAIHAYIEAHNANLKPFRWVKSADDILAAVDRFCRRTLKTNATLRRT